MGETITDWKVVSVSRVKKKQGKDMNWWPVKEDEAILLAASLWKELNPDQLLLEIRKDDYHWCDLHRNGMNKGWLPCWAILPARFEFNYQ